MDLVKYQEESQLKRKENKQFFKRLKKVKPKVLDSLIHPLHDAVFENINCLECVLITTVVSWAKINTGNNNIYNTFFT